MFRRFLPWIVILALIPGVLWADTLIFADGFNKADAGNTNLDVWTSMETGTAWEKQFDEAPSRDMAVFGSGVGHASMVSSEANDIQLYAAQPTPTNADVFVEAFFQGRETTQCDPAGIMVRSQGTIKATDLEFYFMVLWGDGTGTALYYFDTSGVANLLDSDATDIGDGDGIKLEIIGSSIKGFTDTTGSFIERLSATDTNISAAGEAGIAIGDILNDNSCDLDGSWDWESLEVTEIEAAAPAAPRDRPHWPGPFWWAWENLIPDWVPDLVPWGE